MKCFIRKNNKDLIDKLWRVGIDFNEFDNNDYECLAVNHNIAISVPEDFIKYNRDHLDCGVNEKLFINIASIDYE